MTPPRRTLHEEERLDRPYDARLMRRLMTFLQPYTGWVVISVGLLSLGAAIELVGPYLTQQAIDRAIPAQDYGLLTRFAILYLATLVAGFGIGYAQAVLTAWIGQRVMFDLRRAIFARLQELSIAFFDRNPVGRLMTRLTSDVETLNELFTSGVVAVFGDLFTLVAIVSLMTVMDWRLTLVAMAALPAVWLAAAVFRRYVRQTYRDIRIRVARINAFLQERLSGMRVVQLFGREQASDRGFGTINRAHRDAHLASIKVYAIFFPLIEVLASVALGLLLWYGGVRLLGETLSVGVLAAFVQLTRRSFRPLQDLAEKYNVLQSAMASSERIFRLLDQEPTVPEPPSPVPLPRPVAGKVTFENVWFRYGADGSPWVLRDVSFTASPGQTIALVGHTGAGKTTVVNLLMRLYDPQRGRILVDGHDIRAVSLRELRSLIGLVQQDLFLFTDDLLTNLTLGAVDREPAAREAAKRVGVEPLVEQLPGGWSYRAGERGHKLSVGERQLLALARALATEPTILVLDEATSSIDTETEARVQTATRELTHGRTSIVVAHRLSTVLEASQILVMHHGEICERGAHRELLRAGGLYQRLYQLQLGDSIAQAS